MRWAWHAALMDDMRNAYRVLVGNLGGKRPLATPRLWWEDNIKMNHRDGIVETGFIWVRIRKYGRLL
jgi:hypothetical protein